MGLAHDALGHARPAVGCLEQAILISQEIGDRHDEADLWLDMSSACAAGPGNSGRILECLEKRLAIVQETGDRDREGTAWEQIGHFHSMSGNCRLALECFEKHMVIARGTGDRPGEGSALFNSANELWKLDARAEARRRMAAAVELLAAIEHADLEMAREVLAEWTAESDA